MTAWPYLIIVALLGAFMVLSVRNRRRQAAAEIGRIERIDVGADVMTTSGLYGTVVSKHDDGTVVLAIAPGVEVKWALAALRDADSLDVAYRGALAGAERADPDSDPAAPGAQPPEHDQHHTS